jgi:hypothetical protein
MGQAWEVIGNAGDADERVLSMTQEEVPSNDFGDFVSVGGAVAGCLKAGLRSVVNAPR